MKKINEFIQKHMHEENVLFIMKGFNINQFREKDTILDNIINNKIMYLVSLSQEHLNVITFEEFICLYDFIIAQYKKIYIFENGIYSNLYPVNVYIPEKIILSLLAHFNEDIESDILIEDIDEYLNIYNNFIQTDDGYVCCYNILDNYLKIEKIERIIIGENSGSMEIVEDLRSDMTYINLYDELDYYHLVQNVQNNQAIYAIVGDNYSLGKDFIFKKLQILAGSFPKRINIYQSPIVYDTRRCDDRIYELLKQYWTYSSFRQLTVYNLKDLEVKKKTTIEITQEDIIYDIISQVENCINKSNFQDIFVTASTGSGKSLMFQVPAIYLAEKYALLTIVVTPLIGLMNDQVQALHNKGYQYAETINSDISPLVKQEILEKVANGNCHILYLSPESLLSRSDMEQLIGKRSIGMLVVDESHIVTTWGKQFRPDYWYLGDHVQKLRKAQVRKGLNSFIIATFTATAIYEGTEDMYHETINSLHMIDPITYLGYIRRDNISIEVSEVEVKKNKTEYEINKFDALIKVIHTALMRKQKVLIYFPTVALINRFHDYCYSKNIYQYVSKYHGQMPADVKVENFKAFLNGEKLVMLATKAFGMGIDIPDISIVSHFAPTGNVCDYIQEIGRAARNNDINGYAIYKHMSTDFKHINKLHGLSAIRKYQLVEVIKKILELYTNSRYSKRRTNLTKKKNEMLVDAESFSYIFEGPQSDENELINKVKTAMLLIQKDYENRGFSPFYIRPIPLFAYGYFSLTSTEQKRVSTKYGDSIKLIYAPKNVCEINLRNIWEKSYDRAMSFPKFKYLLYSKSSELDFNLKYSLKPAMLVEIYKEINYDNIYKEIYNALKIISHKSIYESKYLSEDEMMLELKEKCKINLFRAESIVSVFLAAVDIFQREYSNRLTGRILIPRVTTGERITYQFTNAITEFFIWLQKGFEYIQNNELDQKMYIVDEENIIQRKQIMTTLGLLETMGVLRFKSLGGSNSQIYIYINETKNMQIVRDKPNFYKNKLLEMINKRHNDSVWMLTYLFQNKFTSTEIWDHLENYFLGILPTNFMVSNTEDEYENVSVVFQIGESVAEDYDNWSDINALFECMELQRFDKFYIPLADYYAAKLIIGESEIEAQLVWNERKIVISSGEESEDIRKAANESGWKCIPINEVTAEEIAQYLRG